MENTWSLPFSEPKAPAVHRFSPHDLLSLIGKFVVYVALAGLLLFATFVEIAEFLASPRTIVVPAPVKNAPLTYVSTWLFLSDVIVLAAIILQLGWELRKQSDTPVRLKEFSLSHTIGLVACGSLGVCLVVFLFTPSVTSGETFWGFLSTLLRTIRVASRACALAFFVNECIKAGS